MSRLLKRLLWLPQSDLGFTLVELMVTISVMAIMVGAGYSGFSSLQRREGAHAAANTLAMHLNEARIRAIEKHASHTAVITPTGYVICREESPPNYNCTDAGDEDIYNVTVASDFPGVTMTLTPPGGTGPNYVLRFDVRGVPYSTNDILASGNIQFKYQSTVWKLTISAMGRITVEQKDL